MAFVCNSDVISIVCFHFLGSTSLVFCRILFHAYSFLINCEFAIVSLIWLSTISSAVLLTFSRTSLLKNEKFFFVFAFGAIFKTWKLREKFSANLLETYFWFRFSYPDGLKFLEKKKVFLPFPLQLPFFSIHFFDGFFPYVFIWVRFSFWLTLFRLPSFLANFFSSCTFTFVCFYAYL